MLVPRVKFFETPVSTSPIRPNVRNRIGIVAPFTRGPTSFRFIGGYKDFANNYGSDTAIGSLAFQAAWDQGAKEFGLVRILGRGKPAKARINFGGIPTKNNVISLTTKFIGEAVNQGARIIKTPIYSIGSYLGNVSGRYWFRVTNIDDDNFATIKYVFIPLGIEPNIWWNDGNTPDDAIYIRATDYTILNITEDAARPLAIDDGVFISFGSLNQIDPIDLSVGDTWSIRVNSDTYPIDIYADALPNQIGNSFRESLEGKDPLGRVMLNETNDGVIIELQPELEGSIGNNYTYFVDIREPDGEVICEGSYFSGESYIQIPVQFANYIEPGAAVSVIEEEGIYTVPYITDPSDPGANIINTEVLASNVRVDRVEVPQLGDGLAVVWLTKPIVSDLDSIAIFRFVNNEGLSISNYTYYNAAFMSGGEDGPRRAYRDFFSVTGTPLLRIFASSEGGWGNNLRLTVFPVDNKSFRLTVRDLNKDNYDPAIDDETFNVSFSDTDSRGYLRVLDNSNHIRGVFLPKNLNPNFDINLLSKSPARLAPPDKSVGDIEDIRHPSYYGPERLKAVSLENGYDGPTPDEQDYLNALTEVRSNPVHILLCPGSHSSAVINTALIAQAESSQELEGLRIAILNAKPRLKPEAAKSETLGVDSRRAVMVSGWCTYSGQPNAPKFGLSPDAVYAGKLAAIPFYAGPNARTTSGPVYGISEVDNQAYASMSQLQVYTDARLEILSVDQALGAYYFINGRTLTANTAWDKISIRRTYDMIRMDLFSNLQQYKSEPNTSLLRRQIQSSVDSYMAGRARAGEISQFLPCTVSSPDVTTGVLNVYISFLPIYAADYIDVYLIRAVDGAVSLLDN